MKSSLAMLPIETRFVGSHTSTNTRRFFFLAVVPEDLRLEHQRCAGGCEPRTMLRLALGRREVIAREGSQPRDLARMRQRAGKGAVFMAACSRRSA
jgi:hypothetical protein